MLPKTVLYDGSEGSQPEQISLRAGPLSMVFEPEEGSLRTIRLGDREVLRGIYIAVRDHNWDTITPRVSHLHLEITKDTFQITFDVECKEHEVDFFWKGILTGDTEGTVTFVMEGIARSTFRRNRIGFCILHPIRECAGQPCTIEKVDGIWVEDSFPYFISPHQPFMEVRAISHEVVPGLWAEVRFEGEVFEMEDQRNWTDASFKTYGTPLALPFPVDVQQGTSVTQSVTLTLKGDAAERFSRMEPESSEVDFTVGEATVARLPRIGLGMASHEQPLSDRAQQRLKALHLSHLRVDLKLSEPDYQDRLKRATVESRAVGTSLEVALHLTDAAAEELKGLIRELEALQPQVSHWLVFHEAEKSTSESWVQLARRYLSGYDFEARIGAGTNAYFAELNRRHLPVEALDLVCYSLNPQVHAFDSRALVETVEIQAATVESARQFIGDLPLVVTPVTLKPRFNPNATGPEPEAVPGELPPQVDVRQMSLLGAGWTVGSLKYLLESGVHSITYYETTGWRGVMETEEGPFLPAQFRSLPGSVFPIYHVLADVGEFTGGDVLPTTSSDPLRLAGLAVRREGRMRVLLANLTAGRQQVHVRHPGQLARIRYLDETNVEEAMRAPEAYRQQAGKWVTSSDGVLPLELLPYAVVCLEVEEGAK